MTDDGAREYSTALVGVGRTASCEWLAVPGQLALSRANSALQIVRRMDMANCYSRYPAYLSLRCGNERIEKKWFDSLHNWMRINCRKILGIVSPCRPSHQLSQCQLITSSPSRTSQKVVVKKHAVQTAVASVID